MIAHDWQYIHIDIVGVSGSVYNIRFYNYYITHLYFPRDIVLYKCGEMYNLTIMFLDYACMRHYLVKYCVGAWL